jgi:hypothetical protein
VYNNFQILFVVFFEAGVTAVATIRVDAETGERWKKLAPPIHSRPIVYELLTLLLCALVVALGLWLTPQLTLSPEGYQHLAYVEGWLKGQGQPATYLLQQGMSGFDVTGLSPVPSFYTIVLLGITMLVTAVGKQHYPLPWLHAFTFLFYAGSLWFFYGLAKRYISSQFWPVAVTALYALLPFNLQAAMGLSGFPLFQLLALWALSYMDSAFGEAKAGKLAPVQSLRFAAVLILMACATHPMGFALAAVFVMLTWRWMGFTTFARWSGVFLVALLPLLLLGGSLFGWMPQLRPRDSLTRGPVSLVTPNAMPEPMAKPKLSPKQLVNESTQALAMLSVATMGSPVYSPASLQQPRNGTALDPVKNAWLPKALQPVFPMISDIVALPLGLLIGLGFLLLSFSGSGVLGLLGVVAIIGLVGGAGLVHVNQSLVLMPVSVLALAHLLQRLLLHKWFAWTKVFVFAGLGLLLFQTANSHLSFKASAPQQSRDMAMQQQHDDFALRNASGALSDAGNALGQQANRLSQATSAWFPSKGESSSPPDAPVAAPTAAMALAASSANKANNSLRFFPQRQPAQLEKTNAKLLNLPEKASVKKGSLVENVWSDLKKMAKGKATQPAISARPFTTTPSLLPPPKITLKPATVPLPAFKEPQGKLIPKRFEEAADWLSQNTSPQSIIMSPYPSQVAMISGRSVKPHNLSVSATGQKPLALEQVQYIISDSSMPLAQAQVDQLRLAAPQALRSVYESPGGKLQVWKVTSFVLGGSATKVGNNRLRPSKPEPLHIEHPDLG